MTRIISMTSASNRPLTSAAPISDSGLAGDDQDDSCVQSIAAFRTLPPIWREDRAFSDHLFAAHGALGIALAVVICAHVGGALFHHFIRKDRVLMRMLTG
jgi:cytochrome b561